MTDGIDLVDQIFQIIVNNVNEAPYAIDNFPSVFYISENENIKPESIIGTVAQTIDILYAPDLILVMEQLNINL